MAAVAVLLGAIQTDLLAEGEAGQFLPGLLGEGLLPLGCVDGAQADLDLFIGARLTTASGKGVAIGNADDEA